MKKIPLFLLFLFPLAVLAQKGFTIKGKVGKLDTPAMAYLQYTVAGKTVNDSAAIKKGKFSFKGSVDEPTNSVLKVKHHAGDTVRNRADWTMFYLENATMKVEAADSIKHAKVKGSTVNNDNYELDAWMKPVMDQMAALRKEWTGKKRQEPVDSAYDQAAATMQRLMKEGKAVNEKFIASHRDSYVALMAFRRSSLEYNFDPATAETEFNKFPETLRSTELGKKVAEKIDLAKRSVVGVTALDFELTDTLGHHVKLSDFKGRYVLVDFWASWCVPCRAENPNLVKAYDAYKDKNFTILGVSLDEAVSRKAWLRAIRTDGMTWPQVSDLQGWKSSAAKLYGIDAIPSNFLVDPTGKIIARNLRGEELNKKLSEIL